MDRLKDVLSQASSLIDDGSASLEVATGLVVSHIQVTMGVSRATLWALDVDRGQRVIRRVGGYDAVLRSALVGNVTLREEDIGELFALLVAGTVFACEDTLADPRLQAIRSSHLLPDDIRASITAPVNVNGQVVGLVNCAQRAQTRHWAPKDIATMRRIADEIAIRHVRRLRMESAAALLGGFELARATDNPR